jgi:hypothetical protein
MAQNRQNRMSQGGPQGRNQLFYVGVDVPSLNVVLLEVNALTSSMP